MSMNLHCEAYCAGSRPGYREVDLWQTPTQITHMCLSLNENGEPDGGMEGVRRRYLIWLDYKTNGIWTEDQMEVYHDLKKAIKEHTEEILALENPQLYTF